MKNFLKSTFSTFIALILFAFFCLFFIISSLSALSDIDIKKIDENSVLVLDLKNPILDRKSDNPFENLNAFNITPQSSIEMKELLDNIKSAKNNENIEGIYLNLSLVSAGFSQVEEIRNQLLDFKQSDKFIYAYSESFSQLGYYLASVSDKIYLNPEGSIMLNGISAGVMFYKDMLSKIGVEAQIIRHGKYKSAVEPFMYNEMSNENRNQLEKLLNSITNKMVLDISQSRGISEIDINEAINRLELTSSNYCKEMNFVDDLYYEDQVLDLIEDNVNSYSFITYSEFLKSNKEESQDSDDKIAIIYATGPINTGKGTFNTIGSITTVEAIREAKEDDNIKAIVLRVNSPGGSALASEIIWRELNLAKLEKKIVVSMGDYAASGGYYIACGANKIFANVSTITGSIGVFGVIPNTQELLNNKFGIHVDTVNTHTSADIFGGVRPLTIYEKSVFQREIGNVYETFLDRVSEGRSMNAEDVNEIAQGRVWSGEDAVLIGLVDEIGGLEDAIESAALLADIDDYSIIKLPLKIDPIDELFEDILAEQKVAIAQELGLDQQFFNDFDVFNSKEVIQAKMPFIMKID